MERRRRACALTILIVFAVLPLAGVGSGATTPLETGPTLQRTTTLSLTPDTPGEIDFTVSFTVPDSVTQITTRLPEDARGISSQTFTHIANTTWRWQRGNGTTPTLSFSLPANETGTSRALRAQGTYLFVDVGPWAIVDVPPMPVRWTRTGPPVTFTSRTAIDGVGATGGDMAYLGEYRRYTHSAHDQTFHLIVPAAATLQEEPAEIFESLASASDTLRVGERDPEVFFIAAPTSVNWGARGLAGGSDAWVLADEPLDTPTNPWLHEYLHTRESFRPTSTARWTIEAIASYYAAFLTLKQDRIQFEAFREHLARGTQDPYAEAILSQPQTWAGGANYLKGALVWGSFDYNLRQATESHRSASDLFARLNAHEDEVTGAELLAAAEAIGGENARNFLDYYTTEPATPDPWTRSEHQAVFDVEPPRMVVDIRRDQVRVTGPYRNQSSIPHTMVVGETITVTATVENIGELTGTYESTLTVNGRSVATSTVTVRPEVTVTVELAHQFEEPGIQTVAVGSTTLAVRVAEPATPTVTELQVNRTTISPGQSVTVTITAENAADWPGGPLSVTVDGEQTQTLSLTLLPGETTTTQIVRSFSEPGEHEIQVGDQRVTVTVSEQPTQPGFGIGTTAIAVLGTVGAFLLYRRFTQA